MMKIAAWISVILIFTGCQSRNNTRDEGPTRWFGPSGNGFYADTDLLKKWPAEGPEVLWTYDSLGEGFSSAVAYHGSVFTTGMIDSIGYLFHLDSEGHLVYRVPYGLEWTGSYRGTRGSPTIAGDQVYVVSGRGKLLCFNKADGVILWSKEFFSDFDGKNIQWGINETPVVDGDLIYVTPGGKEYNVVALNRHSGDIEWSCRGEGEVSAYCTPLLFYHNGRKMLVTYSASHLLGIEPLSGELLWSVDVPREYSVHLCTPIYDQGELYYPTGREKGGGKIRLSEDGESVSELWENQVNDYRVSAIKIGAYTFESFSDYKRLTWRCVDWVTGDELFTTRELGPGRAIYADSMLYVYTYKGELAMVEPVPGEFHVVSQVMVRQGSGLHQAMPVIHDRVLYIRHGNSLVAYKI